MNFIFKNFKSKVFLLRNWMGGTNVFNGLNYCLKDSNVSINYPEADYWKKGFDVVNSPNNFIIPCFKKKTLFIFFEIHHYV